MAVFLAEFHYYINYSKDVIDVEQHSPLILSRLVKAHTEMQATQKARKWWDENRTQEAETLSEMTINMSIGEMKLVGVLIHPVIE